MNTKTLSQINLVAFIALLTTFAYGSIAVDTSTNRVEPSDDTSALEEMMTSGVLDRFKIRYDGQDLTRDFFISLDRDSQNEVLERLNKVKENATRKSYVAKVNTKTNDLQPEPLFPRLQIPIATLAESVGAEFLLSKYAQKWAYKMSDYSGPNCYHTSIASIFLNWNKHRYMGPSEFKCHLKTYFEEIAKPERYGDLIGIFTSSGSPIHGFTYLGPDRNKPENIMVFTKNGYAQSRYYFMTYNDVYQIYGGSGTKVKYYRPIKEAIDPSEHPGAPCASRMIRSFDDEPTLELPDADLIQALKDRQFRLE